ncbi:unnamed protein product [Candidula unifasciata]|uniref:Guanylate kinase-like domain-containing protein n=1 Tax=Candidula unifasciata TaxID=100452 RepID=A0A8S3YR43_9EUPU|nr:unnamed protein product [Candidula unifasciata]
MVVGDAEMMTEVAANNEVDTDQDRDVELSPGGVLDEETITRGLSNLGRSANGCHQVYLNLAIPGFSLTDISLLSEYQHLQKVEIPYNDITDLSALGNLKYLLFLDASHNRIEHLLDFDPPFNLQEVDMSWNNIKQMCDLSEHPFLKKLILDNNNITTIQGLEKCKQLKHLSLAHNKIRTITGLDHLPIQHLNLSNNNILFIDNFDSLKHLKELNLSRNCIRSLSGLENNTLLEAVDLESNEVIDILEVKYLRNAKNLRELSLLRNPIQELPDYRLCILYKISRLVILDRHPIKEQEKVLALNMFNPPMGVVAARDHITNVVYSFLQPAKVWDSTLPNIGTPYPMLVLVGPQGSGKRYLATKLVKEFSEYFGYGISHTTRHPHLEESAGKDYFFVSVEKFEKDVRKGAFLQTCLYNGNWYGLQMGSVERVAKEGLACVVHMELEGVLSLKKTYFEPRYVLVLPLDSQLHEKRLRARHCTDQQIPMILQRTDMYIQQNQDHPGFFDMMICSDDIGEAYAQLRKLVMDYLGIGSLSSSDSSTFSSVSYSRGTADQIPVITTRTMSNVVRASTWSRTSDNFSQPRGPRLGSLIQSRGTVEEESVKRRYSVAKDVITGNIQPPAKQWWIKYPTSVSVSEDSQSMLKEMREKRAQSAPTILNEFGTVNGEDKFATSSDSSSDTPSESYLSDLDSAPGLHKDDDHKSNINANFMGHLPTEKIDPLSFIDKHNYRSASATHLPDAFTQSFSRPGSKCIVSRPGSDRNTVLPPIQNMTA